MPMLKIKLKTRPKVYEEVKQALENGEFLIADNDEALYVLSEIISSREAIVAKKGDLNYRIILDAVEFIETEGHYLRLSVAGDSFIIRKTITEMLEILPHNFLRISNSSIVNMSKIVHIGVMIGLRFNLTMKSGKHQYVSRTYYSIFRETLGF